MSAPDKKSLEAYNKFLTRKRWTLIDGLWLLNGFYMWRKEEFVEPAIDSIAEKNRTEIEKLQDKTTVLKIPNSEKLVIQNY